MPHILPKTRVRTVAVHAGRDDLRSRGVHAPPLDLSTTYPISDLDAAVRDLDRWSAGAARGGNPIYARVFNETVARFEVAIAALEGTEDAVAFASGMAAFSGLLLALSGGKPGHIVAIRPLYGTSDHVLSAGLFGFDVSWARPEEAWAKIRPDTACVVFETPQNPTLGLVDIADVAARVSPVPVLVDNTFATPILQQPARHGAAFVLHSATKFIGGHGDAVGGVIATNGDWAGRLRKIRFATGALLHPLGGYLLHRGLPTLPLRVRAAQATAGQLAQQLRGHPAIRRVRYPAFDPAAGALIGTQMHGPGALLSIELEDKAAARRFVGSLRLALHGVSLGTFDTLVEHPASMTHRIVDPVDLASAGVPTSLVRISIGLEDPADLWADFEQALSQPAMNQSLHHTRRPRSAAGGRPSGSRSKPRQRREPPG
jgi:methionine-gamma-lyase